MRNVSDKSCRENQETQFIYDEFFFENHDICEIKWKNLVQPGRPQLTTRRMRIVCWVQTQNMYNLLLFPCDRCCTDAPYCHYTYVACLVNLN